MPYHNATEPSRNNEMQRHHRWSQLFDRVMENARCEDIMTLSGRTPKVGSKGQLHYLSPFRDEKTPSFTVYTSTNRYVDYAESTKSHNVANLVQRFEQLGYLTFDTKFSHRSHYAQAILWLADHYNLKEESTPTPHHTPLEKQLKQPVILPQSQKQSKSDTPAIIITKLIPVTNQRFVDYFTQERHINKALLQSQLHEAHYRYTEKHPGKVFSSVAFKNRSGGYELRSPGTPKNPKGFKGSVGSKDISLIRGSNPSGSIDVYEGFTDYLSMLTLREVTQPLNHTIVLNSTSLIDRALEYLVDYHHRTQNLKQVNAYLDNDKAGEEALSYLMNGYRNEDEKKWLLQQNKNPVGLKSIGITITNQAAKLYPSHNDLNAMLKELYKPTHPTEPTPTPTYSRYQGNRL